MSAKTNTLDYWLDWRFLTCAVQVFSAMVIATIIIWKCEGSAREETADDQEEAVSVLCGDESWRPCLKQIHPAWLLTFRVMAFFLLGALLVINVVVQGGKMFYYYTQWTFALVTIYFGVGSLLSIHGYQKFHGKADCTMINQMRSDAERGSYIAPTTGEVTSTLHRMKRYDFQLEHYVRPVASFWGYAFQIIYQMTAGAVMLTDCVYWLIIFPFLTTKDYNFNFFTIGMHSINAVFLLGDTALNSLRFPWFRISYFLLLTAAYVIFQWVTHACIPIWWPYPFMDLTSSYAPIWYLSVTMMHLPCYAIFVVIVKVKHFILSRCFARSYLCLR